MLILFENLKKKIHFFHFILVGGENGSLGKNLGCKTSPRYKRIRLLTRRVITRLTCTMYYLNAHLFQACHCGFAYMKRIYTKESSSSSSSDFFINVQVQGPYPQQWAPFQATGLLHAWQISHQISRCLYHEG